MGVDGLEFEDAWQNKEIRKSGDLVYKVISKADLIKNKIAAARPQDLVDVENLKKAP